MVYRTKSHFTAFYRYLYTHLSIFFLRILNLRSLKEVETEKQLKDEVSALKSQIQVLQEEKLASAAAAAAAPVEQPDPTTKIVHFLNNPLQQVIYKKVIRI